MKKLYYNTLCKKKASEKSETFFLEQIGTTINAGQFGEFASLTFYQIDMPENFLPLHTVYHVGQSIGLAIKIRGVDLKNIINRDIRSFLTERK